MRLYTITVQTTNLQPTEDPMIKMSIKEKKQIRDRMRKDMFERLFQGIVTTWQEFSNDSDFYELRKDVDP